jgi:hypothetical protein
MKKNIKMNFNFFYNLDMLMLKIKKNYFDVLLIKKSSCKNTLHHVTTHWVYLFIPVKK